MNEYEQPTVKLKQEGFFYACDSVEVANNFKIYNTTNDQRIMRNHSFTQSTSEVQTTINKERASSVNYSGNKLIRSQYYGSMETVSNGPGDGSSTPHMRKTARFRVEPCEDSGAAQLIARSPSLAQLENPEFQTRWYFKYFLGQVHSNYVFKDQNNNTYALSVCLTDVENHAIPQYRAILWRKSGCRRICIPFDPHKHYTAKEVLRFFMSDKLERNPREITCAEVQKELLVLEEQEGSVNFKFGVIYAKQGQATDDEMFGNVSGSKKFDDFLHVLGDTVTLKGWSGFRGGLDVRDNMTGTQSLYTVFEGHEVMFHVSVMLPYSKDSQQVERKRHIGNDIAVIVFVDGEPTEELAFKPSSIRTKFTHVFAVVRYSKSTNSYWLSVLSEENVPVFGPSLPVPPKFSNPQEFRSFLITKLMNGEKAAYVSPVFSNKRQRTLESLIDGLQDDKWQTQEVCMQKLVKLSGSDHVTANHGLQGCPEKRNGFLKIGQELKVNKIMQGCAPTSVAHVGGLFVAKNNPWTPNLVLGSFSRRIICGDSYGSSLLVSCNDGIFLVSDEGSRHMFDSSMTALQINVVESRKVFVIRIRKNGRIYVIPLSELENKRPFAICRRQLTKYYLKRTKGCHIYTLSRKESDSQYLAIAVSKRISLYCWNDTLSTQPEKNNQPAGFEKDWHYVATEPPRTITITTDVNGNLMLCLGLRLRFDVINVSTREECVVKNIVMYRKPKIVSALDVFDDNNPELLLTYSHSSVFVRMNGQNPEIVSFYWNNAPKDIVCAFPYILGFSQNSIEIRLMVNGNLVHTLAVPHLKLVTAKEDIFFTSSTTIHTNNENANRSDKKRQKANDLTLSFMKINLSDLAGLNFTDEPGDHDDIIYLKRNIGVYASYSGTAPKKLLQKTETHTRNHSVSVTGSINRNSPQIAKQRVHSKSCEDFLSRGSPVTLPRTNNGNRPALDDKLNSLNQAKLKQRAGSYNKAPAGSDGTSFFYEPRKMSHHEELQRQSSKMYENNSTPTIPAHRRSLPEKTKLVRMPSNQYEMSVTPTYQRVTTIV